MEYTQNWFDFIAVLREFSPSLAAILSNSNLVQESDTLVKIDVFGQLHLQHIDKPESIKFLQEAALVANLPKKTFTFMASGYGSASNTEIVDEVMSLLS